MWAKYVFRMDDIVPWMNWDNFEKIEKIFDKYWVKPIIWVVPNNQDFTIWNDKYTKDYWNKINGLVEKWRIIAQHWYSHKYVNNNWWILNINHYGEFAWLSYKRQFETIKNWKDILEKKLNTKIKWRMAPAHSFDGNTCKVLNDLQFEFITDWIALYPFTKYWLKWLPQQIWKPQKKKFWIWTVCLHINHYDDKFIESISEFVGRENKYIINPEMLDYNQNLWNKVSSYFYKIRYYLEKTLYKVYVYLMKVVRWKDS